MGQGPLGGEGGWKGRWALETARGAINARDERAPAARTTRGRGRGVLLLLDAEAEEEGTAAQRLGGRRRAALGVKRCGEGQDGPDLGGPEVDERFLVVAS